LQIVTQLASLLGQYGYLVVFVGVTLEGVGLPLPGETVLVTAGALAHRGTLGLWQTMTFGSLGTVIGGQAGYCIGRFGGRQFVVRWGRYVFITRERLADAEGFFDRHGGMAVFIARFVVGLRVFGALAAGISRMPWRRFALYNALGGVIWATAAVSLGYLLWTSVSLVENWAGRVSIVMAAVLILIVILRWTYRKIMKAEKTQEHRKDSRTTDKRAGGAR